MKAPAEMLGEKRPVEGGAVGIFEREEDDIYAAGRTGVFGQQAEKVVCLQTNYLESILYILKILIRI